MKAIALAAVVSFSLAGGAASAAPCGKPAGAGAGVKAPLAGEVGNVAVYPNPWRSDRNRNQSVTFQAGAPLQHLMVFTASGRWVRNLDCSCGFPTATWDLTNDAGEPVKSGFYIYVMRDVNGRQSRGSLAVVR